MASEPRAARDRVTLADIAAAAGVSVPTVSKVLNGHPDVAPKTRSRVEALLDGRSQPGPEIIRTGTELRSMPLLPEIRLHQAGDLISMWQRTEQAAGRDDLDPPFWAFPWAGGQALARYLLDHQETVLGRRVIDVASGSGLVAIAAAKAGAGTVTAYDTDPLAAAAIGLNAAANGVTVQAVCADILSEDGPPAPGADLVLVADAFYERDLASQVTEFVGRCRAEGADVLVGDLGRRYLPYSRLTALASYDVPGLGALESHDVIRTTVWTLSGPPVSG